MITQIQSLPLGTCLLLVWPWACFISVPLVLREKSWIPDMCSVHDNHYSCYCKLPLSGYFFWIHTKTVSCPVADPDAVGEPWHDCGAKESSASFLAPRHSYKSSAFSRTTEYSKIFRISFICFKLFNVPFGIFNSNSSIRQNQDYI